MHCPTRGPCRGELCSCGSVRSDAPGGIHLTKRELENLRNEIERIDSEILELISKRQEVSREISLTKVKNGIKLRDRAQEAKVADRITKRAGRLGVDKRLARTISRMLIEDSVQIQKSTNEDSLGGKSALVVGGAGRMGEWTCRFLSNRGAEVKIWDPRGKLHGYTNVRAPGAHARAADIVAVSSPLGVCPDELGVVLDSQPEGLVFDLCSVKTHIASQLRRAAASGVKIASVHPMFGPRVPSPKGLNVLVCDCGSRDASREVGKIFADSGARVSNVYLEEHDRLMAYVLGLSHMTALLFGGALKSSGKKLPELDLVQGTSFAKLAALSLEVSSESRRVYHDIQALNPHTREMIEAMEHMLSELKRAALDADPTRFGEIMREEKRYLEE